jgi:hypothetical protein
MRRSRMVDWLLLASLLSAFAALEVVALRNYLPHAGRWFPFSVTGAQGADGYPLVDRLNVPGIPVRVGDSVLSAGGIDLRGLSRAEVYRAQTPLLAGGKPYRVEIERSGEQLEVSVEPARRVGWEGRFYGFAPILLAAIFLLVRAPHWHLARRFLAAILAIASYPPADMGQLPWVIVTVVPMGNALMLWCALEGTEAARPLRPWQLGSARSRRCSGCTCARVPSNGGSCAGSSTASSSRFCPTRS